jgi:hypothetical protein
MARVIIDNGYQQDMIDNAGNPFAFFYLYNLAAMKSGRHPVFSGKSIEFLRNIEELYCKDTDDTLWIGASPKGLDTSGVDNFWKIADILAQDKEPDEKDWHKLFQNPGYKELVKREGRQYSGEQIQDLISLVFKPSRAAELKDKSKQGFGSRIPHFIGVKNHRKEISQYLNSLAGKDWIDKVISDVKPFLPEKVLKKKALPQICPVFFRADLRYGYDVYVFDPLYGINRKQSIEYYARLFTLKYFHDDLLSYNPLDVRMRHTEVIDVLYELELHGTMENIMGKNRIYETNPPRKEGMDKAYEEALESIPLQIINFNDWLEKINNEPGINEFWSAMTIRDFPLEGRPLGKYLADAIIDTLGQDQLKKACGNPFLFFRTYNKAAEMKPDIYPQISSEAIKVIDFLEKEYISWS